MAERSLSDHIRVQGDALYEGAGQILEPIDGTGLCRVPAG